MRWKDEFVKAYTKQHPTVLACFEKTVKSTCQSCSKEPVAKEAGCGCGGQCSGNCSGNCGCGCGGNCGGK